jgi:predicted dehydrogenase
LEARVVRTTLIGFGRIAELHYVPALSRFRNVAVTAVVEPRADRQQLAQAIFPSARLYPDLQAMGVGEVADALLVASPPSAHREAIDFAIQGTIPLFLEKPFLPPGELIHLREVRSPTFPMMINFNRRFWGPYRKLRERLRAGQKSGPARLRLVMHVNPEKWGAVTEHRMRLEEGGILQDLGSHALDLAAFLLNQEVSQVRTRWQDTGHQVRADLKLFFPEGSSALCSLAYTQRPIERVLAQSGDDFFVILHPMAGLRRNSTNIFSPVGLATDFAAVMSHTWHRRFSMIGATVHAALAHFFTCLRLGAGPQTGWSAALQNATALEAVWRSHYLKRRVDLSEIGLP